MSFLTKPAARSIPRSPIAVARFRPFHTTGLRAALSESDTHRRVYSSKSPLDFAVIPYSCAAMLTQLPKKADEERQADIDHHKNDQLNKQKDGKGHWKGELASNSEAAVKADRKEIHNAAEDTAKMQKETSEHMQDQHKEEK